MSAVCGPYKPKGLATSRKSMAPGIGSQPKDPYTAYRVYDSFTDTNGVNITAHTPEKGGAWSTFGGAFSWTIQGNRLQPTTNAGAEGGIVIEAGAADVTINVTLTSTRASYQALVFNYVDALNFWYFGASVNNGGWTLAKFVAGFGTNLGFDLRPGWVPADNGTYQCTVATAGDTITLMRDGISSNLSQTIGSRPNKTGTKHGLYTGYTSAQQIFDLFTIQ